MDLTDFNTWWPGLVFALGCFVITFIIRRVVEGVVPKMKANHYWVDVVLPTMPAVLGGGVAMLLVNYPYPLQNPTVGVRLLLGLVAGFGSAWAVKIAKAVIKHKTGVDVDANSSAPPVA